jgi:hypothetical protein
MCLYHYLYFSKCQHAQLSRISYCDTAKALGLSERYAVVMSHLVHVCANMDRDGLSQRTAGAGQTAARQQSLPLYHTRASSSTHYRRVSHPHIQQQQQQHSMTLVRFETSAPPAWSSNTANREQSPPCGSGSIPRSALEGHESTSGDNGSSATLRKSRSLRNFNVALPLDAQSSLSIESKLSRSISRIFCSLLRYLTCYQSLSQSILACPVTLPAGPPLSRVRPPRTRSIPVPILATRDGLWAISKTTAIALESLFLLSGSTRPVHLVLPQLSVPKSGRQRRTHLVARLLITNLLAVPEVSMPQMGPLSSPKKHLLRLKATLPRRLQGTALPNNNSRKRSRLGTVLSNFQSATLCERQPTHPSGCRPRRLRCSAQRLESTRNR